MRRIEYLSPTSLSIFYKDQMEFYLSYCATNRPPRFPQTRPMAVGSAFDAYVKSHLHEILFGKNVDQRFEFQTIFEAQVEQQNRDWAKIHGKYCFEKYKESGALADLLSELKTAVGKPYFEIEMRGIVESVRESTEVNISGIPLLGKPDLFFIHKNGTHIIHDFKVNGYCGSKSTSPMKGYVRMRGPNIHAMHKDCFPVSLAGFQINGAMNLEDGNKDWAQQLAIYGWLCGETVGSDFVTAVDQLACSYNGEFPLIRVAEHRLKVSGKFQIELFKKIQHVWDIVNSDHFFRDMSLEESKKRCSVLDDYSLSLEDKWMENLVRTTRRFY